MKCINTCICNAHMRGERPPKLEFICKKLHILTCLNFSLLRSTLHLMQFTHWDIFSTAQNSLRTHWFWCLLVLLVFSCFPSSTLAKHFPLRTFFIQGSKKNVTWDKITWIGRVGYGGHAVLSQKLLNTQHRVGRCTYKSPIMKWANMFERVFS